VLESLAESMTGIREAPKQFYGNGKGEMEVEIPKRT